jgi:hypothetical protein
MGLLILVVALMVELLPCCLGGHLVLLLDFTDSELLNCLIMCWYRVALFGFDAGILVWLNCLY